MRVTSRDMRRRAEGGFTIVEVIVAISIVVIVLGGVIWTVMSSAKAEQRGDIRQKMAAAADGLAQQVRANKDWLVASEQQGQKSCKVAECVPTPLDKYSYHASKAGDPNFTSAISITPIDSDVDGVGNADNDHITPDLYRISVTISLSDKEQAVWGKQAPYNLVSTVDATQLGKGTGSLTVQVCRVNNQVDERMAIAGCKDKLQELEMRYQPPCAPDNVVSGEEVPVREASGKLFPLSCNQAIHATKDMKMRGLAAGSVEIEPATNVDLQIVPADGGLTLTTDMADKVADTTDGDDGSYAFRGLGTGDYQIKVSKVPLGMELWKSHVVPQDLKVSIQNNQHAKALVIIRPVQGTSTYTVGFTRTVYHYTIYPKYRVVFNETPDPEHDAVVHTTTTYTYLTSKLTTVPMVPGASWNGYLGMEPKPFDRYRRDGTGSLATSQQHIMPVVWGQPTVTFGGPTDPMGGLPTGLQSRPEQLSVNQTGMWGQFDKEIPFRGALSTDPKVYNGDGEPIDIFGPLHLGQGKLVCTGLPCGQDYAYINPVGGTGAQTSTMLFNDAADGECWVTSTLPQVPVAGLEILGGLEQENTGVPGADRCERDLMVNGMRIYNFFPDRNGEDGKTVLWRSRMDEVCVPVDQCVPFFDMDRSMIPPIAVPDITPDPALPTPQRTDISPIIRPSDEQIARGIASGGSDPPPPPNPITSFAVNPLMMFSPPSTVPMTKEQSDAKEQCMNYMARRNQHVADKVNWYNANPGEVSGELDAKNWFGLNCDKQCPVPNGKQPYANLPIDVDGFDRNGLSQSAAKDGHSIMSGFNAAGDDTPCPVAMPNLPTMYFEPTIAPPVEPRPFTGPDPDTGGVPVAVPTSFPLPAISGGAHGANATLGTPAG